MKIIIFSLEGFIALTVLLSGCAKVGSPTGGMKDTRPPKYLHGTPENRSTHFEGKEITFWFDEFIQFKDLNKELLVSPPLKEKPVIRIKEKSVRINLMNDLLPATTYTVNFGNAITDLNEGNPLPDFEFVFSTGDHIDSLAVIGKALNAFDHKPLKDAEILVMLYEDLSDSALFHKTPRYIGRASSNGLFSINNIHPDTCRMFAINDVNGNLKYDPGAEAMAFLDTFLILDASKVKPVTFIKDTVKLQKAEKKGERSGKEKPSKTLVDTSIVQGKKLNALDVSLFYFLEETDEVYMTSRKRDSPEKIFFSFSRSPHDSIQVRPLNYKPHLPWFVKETSMNRDSLTYWITDSLMAKKDTIVLAVSYTTTDSTGQLVIRTDTVNMKFQTATEKSSGNRKSKTGKGKSVPMKMPVKASIGSRGLQNLNKPVIFITEKPIALINHDSIEFYKTEDSISTRQSFTCSIDSANLRKLSLAAVWKENTKYRLLLKPNAIKDIFGQGNDSIEIKFGTQKAEYYGRIIISASGKRFPLILQVMDQKERIIDSRILKNQDKITIDYLVPQKYILKAIADNNGNGKWDTGSYLKHRQPEQVFFYKMPVELRSNWDYEVIWEIPD
jgi:hypothetical protein